MTTREMRELIALKDRNNAMKTELNQLIQEKFARRDQELSNAKELRDCQEQVKHLQAELSKERVPRATLGQKMVLLDHFKILDFMAALKLDSGKLHKVLHYILDANEKDAGTAYNQRGMQLDSPLNNASNNKFLVKVFHELEMEKEENWAKSRLK